MASRRNFRARSRNFKIYIAGIGIRDYRAFSSITTGIRFFISRNQIPGIRDIIVWASKFLPIPGFLSVEIFKNFGISTLGTNNSGRRFGYRWVLRPGKILEVGYRLFRPLIFNLILQTISIFTLKFLINIKIRTAADFYKGVEF